jgi:general secretion pathway protein C
MATVAQALRLDGELANQLIGQAPRWITALLVVLLGVRAATLVAQLSSGSVQPVEPAPMVPIATRNVVDIPSILRSNLFGQSAAAPGSTNAPLTSMALLLAGVIADRDEKLGFAMLGTSSADIKFYKVGDQLPGGARLHAVFVDRVLIDRGGTIEAVLIPVRTSGSANAPVLATAPVASGERVQQAIRNNPGIIGQVILNTAVLLPDGRLRGMRVNPGPNAQAFNRLGLRAGDLVTAINGTALDDQARGNEIFNTLSGAAEARVTVVRNGSQLDLTLNLADIANEAERLAQAPVPTPAPNGPSPPGGPESTR